MPTGLISDVAATNTGFTSDEPTALELAVLNLPGFAAWIEPRSSCIVAENGFRLRPRFAKAPWEAMPLGQTRPLLVAGPNGHNALQCGWGDTLFTGTERGLLATPGYIPLMGSNEATVYIVANWPTSAATDGTAGGFAWAARGPGSNDTAQLIIGGSNGRAQARGGSKQCEAAADLRHDTQYHSIRWRLKDSTDILSVSVDGGLAGNYYSQVTAAAGAIGPGGEVGGRSLIIGARDTTQGTVSSIARMKWALILVFNVAHADADSMAFNTLVRDATEGYGVVAAP